MLYRKIYNEIDEWYKSDSKALLIDGARQVGKTTSIETYFKEHNIDIISFNLVTDNNAYEAFETSNSYDELILKISTLARKDIVNNKTVIFIDEIQRPKDAITIIKELAINAKCKFIFSGSLLGIKLNSIESIPAGYLRIIRMYPLDFEEFLIASNVSNKTFEHLKDCFENLKPVDSTVHKQLMNLFNLYLIVGGYPNAVKNYIETNNLKNVYDVERDIDTSYEHDITQYAEKDKLLIKDIYNLIPSELNSQNKRFILKNLNEKERFYQSEESFAWLHNSGIGLFTHNVSSPTYPLLANKNRTLFKLFLCDTGLLSYKLFGTDAIKILNGNVNINYGSLYENVVAKELSTHGYNLFYNSDKKRGEVDFLIEEDTKIIPIEVKSGKDYKRHSALNNLLDNKDFNIEKAYILTNDNLSVDNNRIYLPIYMIMFFNNEKEMNDTFFKVDTSAL